jgi:hypothetical protein
MNAAEERSFPISAGASYFAVQVVRSQILVNFERILKTHHFRLAAPVSRPSWPLKFLAAARLAPLEFRPAFQLPPYQVPTLQAGDQIRYTGQVRFCTVLPSVWFDEAFLLGH